MTGPSDWRSYDAIADAYEQRWGARFESAARLVLSLAAVENAGRVLDLGTGTGALLAALGRGASGALTVGCDMSLPMLAHARRRFRVPVVVCDASRLPFQAER